MQKLESLEAVHTHIHTHTHTHTGNLINKKINITKGRLCPFLN